MFICWFNDSWCCAFMREKSCPSCWVDKRQTPHTCLVEQNRVRERKNEQQKVQQNIDNCERIESWQANNWHLSFMFCWPLELVGAFFPFAFSLSLTLSSLCYCATLHAHEQKDRQTKTSKKTRQVRSLEREREMQWKRHSNSICWWSKTIE